MSHPEQPEPTDIQDSGADKRRHPRAPLQLLVQFRFDSFEDFLAEYAIDISLSGMFIRTNQPRDEGSLIFLQFALKDGARLFEGLGRVVRVNAPGDSDRIPGMGVEFVNFDAESTAMIEEIVAQRLPKRA